jgi:hypothetical protein
MNELNFEWNWFTLTSVPGPFFNEIPEKVTTMADLTATI